ncbi:hypothetical protein Tco_0066623 [Tanacetum coccineum]
MILKVDIIAEHNGYNVMEMIRNDNLIDEVDDPPFSDTESQDSLGDVKEVADFQIEDDSNVEIPKISSDDPWLNKLVGKGKFIGHIDDPILNLNGMRFDTPAQLKQCLANYGVAHGYQLWYMQNDIHKLQVLCGRNVSEGRCAGKRGKKDCDSTEGQSSKVKKKNNVSTGEPSQISKATKERWAKKKEEEKKKVSTQEDCKFRLWASWMSTEKSFQIKTLYPDHNCCRNYNLGALVTYKWIAHHYAREIIDNPWLSYKYMQNSIREKYLIDVSLGQCKRAKQCALFDHEGGLVDHYSRVWEYRQALLESNPGSTCQLDLEEKDDGLMYFKRMYICFLGLKAGWKDACRKVIGLDGCFLTHTCKGQLLTAMGRDANNQMFPIAWAVVEVENKNNWCWFLSLLHDDLELDDGKGLTIISDAHKGLIEAVSTWFPDAEHRQCTRHIYANFKRKWNGLQWKRLFWSAAACTIKEHFLQIMEQIKMLDEAAHKWLVERDPNSWSRAFFEMDRDTAAFENGISESFNSRILNARGKPLITMLEDIRIYLMQRVYYMNKQAMMLEDTITPSIRRQLENLKIAQRKAAFREIWRQNEENDTAWDAYANEFSEADFNQGFEDQLVLTLQLKILRTYAIPTQSSQVKRAIGTKKKGETHFTPADVEPSTPAVANKKRGRPKKATTKPSLNPSTKAAAKKRKGKELASVEASTIADAKKTRGRPKKTTTEPLYGRIYYKNRGRSERIANQNKPFKFDKYGTGSTPDKTFSLDYGDHILCGFVYWLLCLSLLKVETTLCLSLSAVFYEDEIDEEELTEDIEKLISTL